MKGYELLNQMDLVDPAYVLAAEEPPVRRRRRPLFYGVAAACLCAVLLLAIWGHKPDAGNSFSVTAYALEAGDPAAPLEASDLVEPRDILGGYWDRAGKNLYLNLCLRYEGNNIQSVDFTAKEGFFAQQTIGDPKAGENPPQLFVGPSNHLAVYGDEFEKVGDTFTLNEETDESLLVFWGIPAEGMSDYPESIELKAVATFRDGQTQAADLSIDLRNVGIVGSYKADEEEIKYMKAKYEYYTSLPLEDCELVEDSVENVTGKEEYVAHVGDSTHYIRDFDKMEFDEEGFYRSGYGEDGEQVVHLLVIHKDGDQFYGMVYRVPESLRYKE